MNKDEKLIPDLIKWRGQNFTINDWTHYEGNIKLAISYSFLFWSDFIEHEECVFIKDKFSIPNFNNWKSAEYVKNFAQIESVINHIHIVDLFSGEKNINEITFDQIKYLGEKICKIYAVKLKSDFPDRQFIITFNCEEKLELDEYTLTFYQK